MIQQIKDKIVDIAAVIVAIAALFITVKQGDLQSELSKAEWQPYLNIEFIKVDSEPEKGFLLKNGGNGPAVIQSFKYFKNEEDFQKGISHQEWLDSKGISKTVLLGFPFKDVNYLTKGYVIPKESENGLFLLGTEADTFYDSPTAKSMEDVIIEIEYRSLSKADHNIYFLRFCEKFVTNNITEPNTKNSYEQKTN